MVFADELWRFLSYCNSLHRADWLKVSPVFLCLQLSKVWEGWFWPYCHPSLLSLCHAHCKSLNGIYEQNSCNLFFHLGVNSYLRDVCNSGFFNTSPHWYEWAWWRWWWFLTASGTDSCPVVYSLPFVLDIYSWPA